MKQKINSLNLYLQFLSFFVKLFLYLPICFSWQQMEDRRLLL